MKLETKRQAQTDTYTLSEDDVRQALSDYLLKMCNCNIAGRAICVNSYGPLLNGLRRQVLSDVREVSVMVEGEWR